MTYRGPWNAAGTRHRQTPRRYKAVGPVGETKPASDCMLTLHDGKTETARSCQFCGYHVCSCEKPSKLFGGLSAEKCQRAFEQMDALQADMPPQPKTSVEYIRADALIAGAEAAVKQGYICSACAIGKTCHLKTLGKSCINYDGAGLFQVAHPDGPTDETHRAAMQPQGGTAAEGSWYWKVLATSSCDHQGIGAVGCEVCDPLAKVRQASESIGRAWVGSASSDLTGGKTRITPNTDSASMAYSQASGETGINQTQQVMFEGTPLLVGDTLVAVGDLIRRSYIATLWKVQRVYRYSAELIPEPGQGSFLKPWLTDRLEQFRRYRP